LCSRRLRVRFLRDQRGKLAAWCDGPRCVRELAKSSRKAQLARLALKDQGMGDRHHLPMELEWLRGWTQRHPRLHRSVISLLLWKSLAVYLLVVWAHDAGSYYGLRYTNGKDLVWDLVLLIVGIYGFDKGRTDGTSTPFVRALAGGCLIAGL